MGRLGLSWERLRAFWERLGGVSGRLGRVLEASWGRPGGLLGVLDASWKRLGGVLGVSWRRLGGILDVLGASWRHLGGEDREMARKSQLKAPKPHFYLDSVTSTLKIPHKLRRECARLEGRLERNDYFHQK